MGERTSWKKGFERWEEKREEKEKKGRRKFRLIFTWIYIFWLEIEATDPATAIQRYSSFKDKINESGLKWLLQPDDEYMVKKQKLVWMGGKLIINKILILFKLCFFENSKTILL